MFASRNAAIEWSIGLLAQWAMELLSRRFLGRLTCPRALFTMAKLEMRRRRFRHGALPMRTLSTPGSCHGSKTLLREISGWFPESCRMPPLRIVIHRIYRIFLQASHKGIIGIRLLSHWFVRYTDVKHNHKAASRALDFMLWWWEFFHFLRTLLLIWGALISLCACRYLEPITRDDYPHTMHEFVGKRLPKWRRVSNFKGIDGFLRIELLHWESYAHYAPQFDDLPPSYVTDARANLICKDECIPSSIWLPPLISPWWDLFYVSSRFCIGTQGSPYRPTCKSP